MEGSSANNSPIVPSDVATATGAGAATPFPLSLVTGEQDIPPMSENMPESCDNCNAGDGKKPAWTMRPSNGPIDTGVAVMGAASWPALSESTKSSPKSSVDSGSNPMLLTKALGIATSTPSSPSMMSSAFSTTEASSIASEKPTTSGVNNNPILNNDRFSHQKSMKRDGGSNVQVNPSHNNNNFIKPNPDSGYESSKVNRDMNLQNAHNTFRKNNGGSHMRGGGLHQNYGGRRGNHNWNHQRSFNGRDGHMQPRGSSRGYVRTQPPVSNFYVQPIGPIHMQPMPMPPFVNHMGVNDMQMVYYPQGVSFGPPIPAPLYHPPHVDSELKIKIRNQIHFYFSRENLVKDIFLRKGMDENGWIPIKLIASFKKVVELTNSSQLILEALQSSDVVEIQDEKIRKRGDWSCWLVRSAHDLQSPVSSDVSTLLAPIQSVTLDENASNVNAETSLRSSAGVVNSPSHASEDRAIPRGY